MRENKLKRMREVLGERVKLVPAEPSQAEEILVELDPSAAQNLQVYAERGKPTLEDERAYLRQTAENEHDFLFLIVSNETGKPLGTIGLHEHDPHHDTVRFGVQIFRRSERGKGYGSEAVRLLLEFAFLDLQVNKVYGKIFASNIRGRTLYARLGFLPEGVLRQEYRLRGVYYDMVYISMFRADWEQFHKRKGSVQ